jgi:hypothetical protein
MQPDSKRPCPHCGGSEVFRSHRRGPCRGISCAQSESVRSAALIAMLDSMGAEIPTVRHRRMSERPDEPVLSLSKKSGHALC